MTHPRRATAERSRGSRTPEQLPPARPLKDRVGHAGEVAALAYLKEQGFRILARDWRSRIGQIDIVAEDALARGREFVLAGNDVVSDELDEALLALVPSAATT